MPDRLLNFDAIENELRERRRVGQKLANIVDGYVRSTPKNSSGSAMAESFARYIRQWDDIEQQPLRLPKEDSK